ncbi:hypothetical protein H7171_00240 [Candidatus Saccharibacteria bacterium]|nr:hypothetical protein [Candidatus Saccharibacteria bacterium]
MSSKRLYQLLLASSLLLTLAIFGAAYKINGILEDKSRNLVALKATSAGLDLQKASLVKAKKDIANYTDIYNIAKVVVPENKNQAEAVRQIVNLAGANGVKIGSITFPTSSLGTSPASGAGATSNTLATPRSTTVDPRAALSQLTPVLGAPGVYVLAISVNSDSKSPSSYPQLISFLAALEQNRSTAEVTTVNITPDSTMPDHFSFTLSLNAYIKP